jgi:hypothetical protein
MDRPINTALALGYTYERGKAENQNRALYLETELTNANSLFETAKEEKDALHKQMKDNNDEFKNFIISSETKIEKAQELGDRIRNQANYDTYRSSTLKKKGGSYGIMHDSTGLFTVSEWPHTMSDLKEQVPEEEIIDTLTSGVGLTPSQKLNLPTWFAPSQRSNFNKAFETAPNTTQYEHSNYGTLKGIKFGAMTLFNIPKFKQKPENSFDMQNEEPGPDLYEQSGDHTDDEFFDVLNLEQEASLTRIKTNPFAGPAPLPSAPQRKPNKFKESKRFST